jgi:ubiquinone biosynthesis protein
MSRVLTPFFAFRELNRTRQILEVLIKYEFGGFLDRIRIWEHTNIQKRLLHHDPGKFTHLSAAERLRLAITELGPTFIKLGQMLATRPDVVSPEFLAELEKLDDRVAFLPADIIRKAIESELGRPVDEVFSSFEDTPVAAASLAQVHRALLNGEQVAIKVQRPGIKRVMETDLELMRVVASLSEKYLSGAYLLNPVGLVNEFAANISRELDFNQELDNLKHYAVNFSDYPWIKIPRVHEELSSGRLITMEFINGVNINDIPRLKREGYDLQQIAVHGIDISLKSILEYGFFQADPHAGNMFVLPGNVIGLVDYGQMGTVSTRTRYRLVELFSFITTHDEKRLARVLGELMEVEEIIDPHELEEGVASVLQRNTLSNQEFRLGTLLFDLLKLANIYKIPFPQHLLWLTKAVSSLEVLSAKLKEEVNLLEAARPYAAKLLKNRTSSFRQIRESYYWRDSALELLEDLPYDIKGVLHRLNSGKTQIGFRLVNMESSQRVAINLVNRLALVIVTAALFIASALLVLSGRPPLVWDTPILGIIGFIIAVILGLALAVSILAERK